MYYHISLYNDLGHSFCGKDSNTLKEILNHASHQSTRAHVKL
jgi:hypothetical protein